MGANDEFTLSRMSTQRMNEINEENETKIKTKSESQNDSENETEENVMDIVTPSISSYNDNNHGQHTMTFSIDSLTELKNIKNESNMSSMYTPSTSNVHANYFDAAPTASHLIAANKNNKKHFVSLPPNINRKTSIKKAQKFVSSKVSTVNNIKMKRKQTESRNSVTD